MVRIENYQISTFYAIPVRYIYTKHLKKKRKLRTIQIYWSWEETGTIYGQKFVLSDHPLQNVFQKVKEKEKAKLYKNKKLRHRFLPDFWILVQTICWKKGHWTLGGVTNQISDFNNISKFGKTCLMTPLGNSWGNSYTTVLMLDIKSRFTCGKLCMC